MVEHLLVVLDSQIPPEVVLLVIMIMLIQRIQFLELKQDKVYLFHTQELQMVIIWNILNFGLTLMVMEY